MDAFVLRYSTDTAHPHDIVPIYFIHSIDNPFCPIPGCWCHSDQQRIATLLDHIQDGTLTLREAAEFADGRTI